MRDLPRWGLAEVLTAGEESPFCVVPADSQDPAPQLVLYSVDHGSEDFHDPDLHALLRRTPSTVIATHWDDSSPGLESALACGVHGAVSLRLPAAALLAQIESILAGRRPEEEVLPPDGACHPEIGRVGLTPRELDVLGLIASGLTNQEIAERLYLSINSVKTYVRTAYRKIDVERRAQAVVWVERHGLTPPEPSVAPEDGELVAAE